MGKRASIPAPAVADARDWIAQLTTRRKADQVPDDMRILALSGVARRCWRTTVETARQHPGYLTSDIRKRLAGYKLICIAIGRPILDWEDPSNQYAGATDGRCKHCASQRQHSERDHYERIALEVIASDLIIGLALDRLPGTGAIEETHPCVLALVERWIERERAPSELETLSSDPPIQSDSDAPI